MDKILKLIKSTNNDDHILAISLLVHNYSKEEIIEFFNKFGDSPHLIDGVLAEKAFSVNRKQISVWDYYYFKDIGFFISKSFIQLYKHPNVYFKLWDPQEL